MTFWQTNRNDNANFKKTCIGTRKLNPLKHKLYATHNNHSNLPQDSSLDYWAAWRTLI